MLGAATTGIEDLGLEGTVFEEGAAVATIYGAVLAGLGAVAYWFPKASGRRLPELQLGGLAMLGALGGALASVPYLIAGFLDQPAASAVWDNDGPGRAAQRPRRRRPRRRRRSPPSPSPASSPSRGAAATSPATIRGAARPWSGRRRRRRRPTTSPRRRR